MSSLLISPPPPPLAAADLPAMPPTQDELPYDDGVPMETQRHQFQMDLLIDVMDLWLEARGEGFAGGNMFLYYSLEQVRHNTFVGPDFFVALDVPRGERKSWVVWEQGKGPDVVVELLSASTASHDKTAKKTLYARQVRVPEYYWYDPFNPEDFAGFTLHGPDYQRLVPDFQGHIRSPILNLDLGRWLGTFRGVNAVWLRWFTPSGEMLPTEAEAAQQRAEAAQQRAEAAQQRAEAAQQRTERLAERLRQLGVDPDSL
ncbi:MAG: Uma2 family endonuclease [Candidatus Competibacter sp.]|nr:Uma2 family endonuclease [Candidatus Competibacter sp.]MDG4582478.1 Uma2 family endonuclease [Candidatus Competibacter sp.]